MCDANQCDCDNQGLKIEGFIVPCILFLLRDQPSHGYEIMEKLGDLDFVDMTPDPGVVYRHLRRMEVDGKVSSQLEPGSGGPARTVYSLSTRRLMRKIPSRAKIGYKIPEVLSCNI